MERRSKMAYFAVGSQGGGETVDGFSDGVRLPSLPAGSDHCGESYLPEPSQ